MYKKLATFFLACIISFSCNYVLGQDPGFTQQENIKTINVTSDVQINGLNVIQKQTKRAYYDGFGRVIQGVNIQASPLQHDLVQSAVYDNLGRQTKSYLPYADENVSSTLGSYRPNAVGTGQPNFYSNTSQYLVAADGMPYAQQVFDNSPLQRVLQSGMVGNGFQPVSGQHYKSIAYRSNNSTKDGTILQWNVDGTYSSGGHYTDNMLAVVDGIDEDNTETLTFTDLSGHLILKRQLLSGTNLDTYYVYNNAGMISYIIPPAATNVLAANGYILTATPLSNLVFHYAYNTRGQITQETIPGKGLVSTIYDPLNRPVLVQDANMALAHQWRYIKYDAKGRPISHGVYTDPTNGSYSAMLSFVNGLASAYSSGWYEIRSGTVINSGFYTNNIFPNGSVSGTTFTPLEYDYYDDYDLNQDGNADFSYVTQNDASLPNEGVATTAQLKGMPTIVCKSTVFGMANTWIMSVTFYDKRLNPIQVRSNNHVYYTNMLLTDTKTVSVDFNGIPTATKVVKQTSASAIVSVYTQLSYDHMYRITSVSQKYNTGAIQPVASYSYNELGQVVKKGVGYVNSTTWLQNIDMRYNIRGQLLSINNSTLSSDNGVMNGDGNDVFGMQLLYDQTDNNLGNLGKFNGKLSAVKWMSKDGSGNNSKERAFVYSYDSQGRYNGETYSERSSSTVAFTVNHGWDETGIIYDANGNIKNLQRNAIPTSASPVTPIDNLTYTYSTSNPNQLQSVSDQTGNPLGVVSGTGNYTYDPDGNLFSDPYKGISQIYYNSVNRMSKMVFTSSPNRFISYVTDASGTLLRKQQWDNINNTQTLIHTTDYIDNFVYQDGVLLYFSIPEGRVVNNAGTLTQEFTITDQQGNARVSFNTGSTGAAQVVQENSYYGFGLIMPGSAVTSASNKNLYNGGSEWQNDYANLPDYYRTFYRNYDASLGRFMSVDPRAESAESMTAYQYAGNNPIMNNDPMGDMFGDVLYRQSFSKAPIRNSAPNIAKIHDYNLDGNIDSGNQYYDLNGNLVNGTMDVSSTTFFGSTLSFSNPAIISAILANLAGGLDMSVNVNSATGFWSLQFDYAQANNYGENRGTAGVLTWGNKDGEFSIDEKRIDKTANQGGRPDADGYLTLSEANDWYRNGNGQKLTVDINKLGITNVYASDFDHVGAKMVINLFFKSNKADAGLVFGNITVKLYPGNIVKAYDDKYDFDYKPWGNPMNWGRNIENWIGTLKAGDGTPYPIGIQGGVQVPAYRISGLLDN